MSTMKTPRRVRNALSAVAAAVMLLNVRIHDIAFTYDVGTGSPGTVNRGIPFRTWPCKQNVATPVLSAGLACVVDTATNSVRQMAAGDTAVTRLYGITTRAFPTQQVTSASLGAPATIGGSLGLPTTGAIDVLTDGAILVNVVGIPTKDGAVFVWVAATGGGHTQGGFEAAATGGSTATIANARFNGPPGPDGVTEVLINQT